MVLDNREGGGRGEGEGQRRYHKGGFHSFACKKIKELVSEIEGSVVEGSEDRVLVSGWV